MLKSSLSVGRNCDARGSNYPVVRRFGLFALLLRFWWQQYASLERCTSEDDLHPGSP